MFWKSRRSEPMIESTSPAVSRGTEAFPKPTSVPPSLLVKERSRVVGLVAALLFAMAGSGPAYAQSRPRLAPSTQRAAQTREPIVRGEAVRSESSATHALGKSAIAPSFESSQPAHKAITENLFRGEIIEAKPFKPGVAHGHPLQLVKVRDPNTRQVHEALWKPRHWGDDNGNDVPPHEYVGYKLNQLLGMDYVPPVAYRYDVTLNGVSYREGALLYKVPEARTLSSVPKKDWGFDAELFESDVRILDVIQQNADRHAFNVLLGKHWTDGELRPVLIDNAGSFKSGNQVSLDKDWLFPGLPNFNSKPVRVIRQRTFAALKALDFAKLKVTIGPFLNDGELRGILARRDGIVAFFEQRAAELGRANVISESNR